MEILKNPVIIAILSALAGAFLAFVLLQIEKLKYKKEIKELKRHIANHMEITAEGTQSIRDELKKEKTKNENLRVTLKTLQQKTDKKEVRLLYIYDKALSKLIENAPGFGPMWVKAVKEAEEEYTQVENGFIAFTKKMLGLSSRDKLTMYSESETEDNRTDDDR